MAEEKLLTLHPRGKSGKNIPVGKYELIKTTMLEVLKLKELSHAELFESIAKRLAGQFDGNVSWYSETVKLDLEARNLIERVGSKPEKYRLIG